MIQLKSVGIWNRNGDRRDVDFRLGELNVITGEAKTGKSALLEIVDYCLGRSTVTLPQGVLTQTVVWYGLIALVDGQSIFVGRPGPQSGQASVSGAQLAIGGPDLTFPDFDDLELNANADAVTEYLTRASGIGEYEDLPPAWSTRPPLRPTIRHASLFCFQRQNEIANPRQLFHRQDEDFMPQAIQSTLPYFLGAVDRDAPTLRSRLYQLRRDLRAAERQLEEAQRIELRGPAQSLALFAEAVDTGLLPSTVEPPEDPISLLRSALDVSTDAEETGDEFQSQYTALATRSRELTGELRAIAERMQLLRATSRDQDDYARELTEQVSRLDSLELLPSNDETHASQCPLCGSAVEEPDATIADLAEAAATTRSQLESVTATRSSRATAIEELERRASELRQALRETHEALATLSRDRERIRTFRERSMARAYVKGRIVQHLEELHEPTEVTITDLATSVRVFQEEIAALEERLDPENEREQVVSRLNVIGDDMTEWAERLHLEHIGGRVRIDASQLTVVVDTRDGPIPLERMGSASNWVGYHLVSHLALHKWFAEQNRPVPRFVMIDQPTQAFYPPDVTDVSTEDLSDDDRQSVDAMFALMRDVVERLESALQVIVMDHANLSTTWFQDSVVEVWRDGRKLVPTDWVDQLEE